MQLDIEQPIPSAINFTWKEFLYLRQWDITVYPTRIQAENIRKTAYVMERIRSIFGRQIFITSGLRPEAYNKKIKGAVNSAHIQGLACDFFVKDIEGIVGCEHVRERIKPHLDAWGFRMENKPDADWVHIDLREPGKTGRFFLP